MGGHGRRTVGLVSLALLLAVTVSVARAAGATLSSAAAATDVGWPQFHFGADRTGVQPNETQIGTGNVATLSKARTYQTSIGAVNPPLVDHGMLYVVNAAKLWVFDASGQQGCSGNPVTCAPLWTAPTPNLAGMTIAGGRLFVTLGNGTGVEAFDAARSVNCSGSPKVCSPLWTTSHLTSTRPAFFVGSGNPIVANGVLYVPGYTDGLALTSGGAYVSAFDTAGVQGCSGTVCTPMWTTTGPPVSSGNTGSPTVANGVVYLADGPLFAFDAAGTTNCSGTPVVCSPLWTTATNGITYAAPAVAGGEVYVGSWNGNVYAYDAGGATNCSGAAEARTCAPLWTGATGGSTGGTPAVANGVVYTFRRRRPLRVRRRGAGELRGDRHRDVHSAVDHGGDWWHRDVVVTGGCQRCRVPRGGGRRHVRLRRHRVVALLGHRGRQEVHAAVERCQRLHRRWLTGGRRRRRVHQHGGGRLGLGVCTATRPAAHNDDDHGPVDHHEHDLDDDVDHQHDDYHHHHHHHHHHSADLDDDDDPGWRKRVWRRLQLVGLERQRLVHPGGRGLQR
jgi:outer membrane protein assembly factor BamB